MQTLVNLACESCEATLGSGTFEERLVTIAGQPDAGVVRLFVEHSYSDREAAWQSEAAQNGIDLCPVHANDVADAKCGECDGVLGLTPDGEPGCLALDCAQHDPRADVIGVA